jgi:hypothetical protein
MSKATVTWLFLGAIAALAVGLVMALTTVAIALSNGAVHIGGPSVVQIDGAAIAGALPWFLIAGLFMAGGSLAALASWVGALVNTFQLEDKTWFVILLLLGLFSFGWVAMVAYVIAGPDSTNPAVRRPRVATPAGT